VQEIHLRDTNKSTTKSVTNSQHLVIYWSGHNKANCSQN